MTGGEFHCFRMKYEAAAIVAVFDKIAARAVVRNRAFSEDKAEVWCLAAHAQGEYPTARAATEQVGVAMVFDGIVVAGFVIVTVFERQGDANVANCGSNGFTGGIAELNCGDNRVAVSQHMDG